MNEKIFEMAEELSVTMNHLTNQIRLAERMAGALVCSNLTDNEENTLAHYEMMWSFLVGLIEVSKLREKEIDSILTAIHETIKKVGEAV